VIFPTSVFFQGLLLKKLYAEEARIEKLYAEEARMVGASESGMHVLELHTIPLVHLGFGMGPFLLVLFGTGDEARKLYAEEARIEK
jgi:hypothetical protein